MPLKFWDEAFATAIFLINRLPSKVIQNQTPFEHLFTNQLDYSFLCSFSCACLPNLRPYNTRKLQFRSTQCVFLGYSDMHKGFKCLEPSTGWVYVSRDVVFDEHVFPFAHLQPNAGARLRAELSILPDSLTNSNTSFGDAILLDHCDAKTPSTNRATSPGNVLADTGILSGKNPSSNGANPSSNGHHFMCPLAGDRSGTRIKADSSSGSVGVAALGSSLGSLPDTATAPQSSHTGSPGSSVCAEDSTTPLSLGAKPLPDPGAGGVTEPTNLYKLK